MELLGYFLYDKTLLLVKYYVSTCMHACGDEEFVGEHTSVVLHPASVKHATQARNASKQRQGRKTQSKMNGMRTPSPVDVLVCMCTYVCIGLYVIWEADRLKIAS